MAESPKYDLLLRGGRVICPVSGIDGIRDVAIRDHRIAAVAETILPSSAVDTIDVSGVPEPSTWAMLGIGFAAMGFIGFRRTRARSAISIS